MVAEMTRDEMQKGHEAALDTAIRHLVGASRDSDWALIRALVHKAIHLAHDRGAEYCSVATLLAEMIQHAHAVIHPAHPRDN
jgi:hypothetical protein